MATTIGINGFGRIGRLVLRTVLERKAATGATDIDVVGVNDLTDAATLAHLLKYDSVHGVLAADVRVEGDEIVVGEDRFKVFSERDPANLPWGDLGCDVGGRVHGPLHRRPRARASTSPLARRRSSSRHRPRAASRRS